MNINDNCKHELDYQLNVSTTILDIAAHAYIKTSLEISDMQEGKRILDVGGGPKSLLLNTVGAGFSVVMDPVDYLAYIPNLKELFDSKKIQFRCCTIEDSNRSENFDEVWCYNVLPHTSTPNEFLSSLILKVKDGGILRIMEPMHEPYEHHPTKVTSDILNIIRENSYEIIKEKVVNFYPEGLFRNDHIVMIAKIKKPVNSISVVNDKKLKIHIYGLPHTLTVRNDPRMMTCAYTTKVWLLCKKLVEEGHEVVHYGVEESDVPCTENVPYIPFEMWNRNYGNRDVKSFQSFDPKSEVYQYAAAHLPEEINKRIKDPSREVILASFGYWSPEPLKINRAAIIEFGVGYDLTFTNYRVFESYAWQHAVYGKKDELIKFRGWMDAVIPGYIDPEEFEYSDEKKDYLFFIGRIIDTKGIYVAAQLAKRFGMKLKVAGNGDTSWMFTDEYKDTIEYIGVIGVEEKKELFKHAKATLCMTIYVEPFGNVHMESLMAGTPVITTDWGVYTETIGQGIVGYRIRTWNDCLYALENINKISSRKCREWAMATWSLDAVYPKFNAYFEKCAAHFSKGGSWYFEYDNKEEYLSNYIENYEEYTKIHISMVLNDKFIEMGLNALQSFDRHYSNYDISIVDVGLSEENKKRLHRLKNFRQFIEVDKKYGVYWAKIIALKDIAKKGKLLIVDADILFLKEIDEFLFFKDNECIHAVDDFATPKEQEEFNKEKFGNTYLQKGYFNSVPNLEELQNDVTVNCGLIAIDLNNRKSIGLINKFVEFSKKSYSEAINWPYEQGLFNYLVLGEYRKALKRFDYRYNSSAYNSHLLNKCVDDELRVLHYHTEEILESFKEYYAYDF